MYDMDFDYCNPSSQITRNVNGCLSHAGKVQQQMLASLLLIVCMALVQGILINPRSQNRKRRSLLVYFCISRNDMLTGIFGWSSTYVTLAISRWRLWDPVKANSIFWSCRSISIPAVITFPNRRKLEKTRDVINGVFKFSDASINGHEDWWAFLYTPGNHKSEVYS